MVYIIIPYCLFSVVCVYIWMDGWIWILRLWQIVTESNKILVCVRSGLSGFYSWINRIQGSWTLSRTHKYMCRMHVRQQNSNEIHETLNRLNEPNSFVTYSIRFDSIQYSWWFLLCFVFSLINFIVNHKTAIDTIQHQSFRLFYVRFFFLSFATLWEKVKAI